MPYPRIELGKSGEELAAGFLKTKGYKILEKNFKSKLGEIDIIAKHKNTICFIEVKTRASSLFGLPQESVNSRKQHKLSKVALGYLKNCGLLDSAARFDIVCVYSNTENLKIDLIENAFTLSPQYSY